MAGPRPRARGHARRRSRRHGERRRAADRRDRHRHQGARSCATSSQRGARVDAAPCTRDAPRSCSPTTPTRSSSPTAPATRPRSTTSSRRCASSSASSPVCGICLGHQLLCRAVGLETFKLPFGHRGANHPVKDLQTGRDRDHLAEPRLRGRSGPGGARTIDADEPVRWETDFGAAAAQPREPLRPHRRGARRCSTCPAATVQYHPEAGPGPARHACTCSTASSSRSTAHA